MSGKKIGQAAIPVDDIKVIVELTQDGVSRYEIARQTGHSTATVYKYQKLYL